MKRNLALWYAALIWVAVFSTALTALSSPLAPGAPKTTGTSRTEIGWSDDALWSVRLDAQGLKGFLRPYVGSGILGVQVAELVLFSSDESPILSVVKTLYDGGEQPYLPEWSRFRLWVGDQPYTLEAGHHDVEHRLDFRTGEVTLRDRWEYSAGKFAEIHAMLLLPRQRPRTGLIRLDVKADARVRLNFGLGSEQAKERFSASYEPDGANGLLGNYVTKREKREICQGLKWHQRGQGHVEQRDGVVEIQSEAGNIGVDLFHSVGSSSEGAQPQVRVREELGALSKVGWDATRQANAAAWKSFWGRAVFPPMKDRAEISAYLAQQYYLLASLSEEPFPVSPLGLSRIGWRGGVFWDTDLWIGRSILPVWPEFARAHLEYRFAGLEQARQCARETGFKGACYGWITDDHGKRRSKTIEDEIHVNVWVAMAFLDYYKETKDVVFLRERAAPVISGIADFFASRAKLEADGFYHIRRVIGPDEAVSEIEKKSSDDNYLTNLGARHVMQWAREVATLVGQPVSPEWAEVEARLYLQPMSPEGVIPEYTGYKGHGIKQADVILSFCFLDTQASADTQRRNVDYYHSKIMAYGPFMNDQVEALLRMRQNDRNEEWEHLLQTAREFTRGPHHLIFECRGKGNNNAVFLTAIGGMLHTLVYGYYGYSLGEGPRLPLLRDAWEADPASSAVAPGISRRDSVPERQ